MISTDERCDNCRHKLANTTDASIAALYDANEWCRVCTQSDYRLYDSKTNEDSEMGKKINNVNEVIKIKNFEQHIDEISSLIRNYAICVECPVYKCSCKVWGSECKEAFKNWALAYSDDMSMAVEKFIRTTRRISLDKMKEFLQHKKGEQHGK